MLNANKEIGFVGTWHIYEMELWDADYLNMEVQAFIQIASNNQGSFQFGLVSGQIDGKVVGYSHGQRFEFTWEGFDECDAIYGSGWFERRNDIIEGEFRIHLGDDSKFSARYQR